MERITEINTFTGVFSKTSFEIIQAGKTNQSSWWLDETGANWWNRKDQFIFNILYYVLKGKFRLKVGGTWYTISQGHLVYIPAGMQLEYEVDECGPLVKYYVHFNITLGSLPVVHSFSQKNIVYIGTDPSLQEAFNIICCYKIKNPMDILRLHSAGLRIVHTFISHAGLENATDHVYWDDSLEQVMQYINTHFRDALQIKDLAALAGLSKDYFSKKFTARYGCSPIRYINKLRILEAQRLLITTNQSVSKIAESVGFFDSSYFSRLFKCSTGYYPLRFRALSHSCTYY